MIAKLVIVVYCVSTVMELSAAQPNPDNVLSEVSSRQPQTDWGSTSTVSSRVRCYGMICGKHEYCDHGQMICEHCSYLCRGFQSAMCHRHCWDYIFLTHPPNPTGGATFSNDYYEDDNSPVATTKPSTTIRLRTKHPLSPHKKKHTTSRPNSVWGQLKILNNRRHN